MCRHGGETFEDYALLRRHVESHGTLSNDTTASSSNDSTKTHACETCGRSFGRRDSLLRHARTACNKEKKTYTCERCDRSFSTRAHLNRHACNKQKTYTCERCGPSFGDRYDMNRHARTACSDDVEPPLPKRSRWESTMTLSPFVEDPIEPPDRLPYPDALSTDLLDVVREHWSTIRTRVARGPVQTRFNYRLTTLDTTALGEPLNRMLQEQTTAFKINLSYGLILRNKNMGRYRYYHASCNCCGRYLDTPSLITNSKDFDEFLERIRETDVLQWAIAQRPDSAWVCELVTNATFFVNRIIDHPIGCVGLTLPAYVKNNKAVIGLEKDHKYSKRYTDNLCLFRCLNLHRGCDVIG